MKCPNCQLENPPGALRCDCGYDFPSGRQKGSYSSPQNRELLKPSPEKSTRGKYIWLCIGMAIFSFCLAVAIFNFTWMLYAGRLDQFGKSVSGLVLVIIVLGVFADRLWKSILALEPKSNPLFKQKHRKFTFVVAACVGTLFAVSLLGGINAGDRRAKQYARDREISSLLNEFNAQKIKNAAFRKRLVEIRSVRPSTYEEYYRQCLTLEAFLDESEPNFKHTGALVASMSQVVNKYPELRTPGILATVQFLNDMDNKDAQIFAEVREEIAKVKELESLPKSQRNTFYSREIKPILANEEKLAKEENALLVKAQQSGLQIPSDLSGSLKKQ